MGALMGRGRWGVLEGGGGRRTWLLALSLLLAMVLLSFTGLFDFMLLNATPRPTQDLAACPPQKPQTLAVPPPVGRKCPKAGGHFQLADADTLVQHYLFPGQIAYEGQLADVLLSLFVKCMLEGESISCYGWGFVETAGPYKIVNTRLNQPEASYDWEPRIEVRCRYGVEEELVYPARIQLGPDREQLPFYLWLTLPQDIGERIPELHVDDWPRFHVFRNVMITPLLPFQTQDKTAATWLVSSGFIFFPPHESFPMAASLIAHHLQHHLRMGILGEIIYVQHHYACELLKDPEIVELVTAGQLRIVVRDSFPLYTQGRMGYYEQALIYNHALLESWGENRRLLIIDPDEYLILPAPGNISHLYECTDWAEQTLLRRHNILCTDRDQCSDTGEDELKVWTSGVDEPLRYYTKIDWESKWPPKALVLPGKVAPFKVHYGFVYKDGELLENGKMWLKDECGFLAHTRSLFNTRGEDLPFKDDTSWAWFVT